MAEESRRIESSYGYGSWPLGSGLPCLKQLGESESGEIDRAHEGLIVGGLPTRAYASLG